VQTTDYIRKEFAYACRVAFFVYILASKRNGTLYVGTTDNLARRIWQHRNGTFSGFTQRNGKKPGSSR
jgi:predicted GIY-YIG superfamily endonuclease